MLSHVTVGGGVESGIYVNHGRLTLNYVTVRNTLGEVVEALVDSVVRITHSAIYGSIGNYDEDFGGADGLYAWRATVRIDNSTISD